MILALGGAVTVLVKDQRIVLSDKCYLDLDQGDLVKNGLRFSLSKKESRLMYRLAQDLGRPVQRQKLITYVWGTDGMPPRNSLYQCIHRIRERLEDDAHHPKILLPVKGFGYMLHPMNPTNVSTFYLRFLTNSM